MSRQQNTTRDRKQDMSRRDAASSGERYVRNERDGRQQHSRRDDAEQLAGFNRYRLNDLYERSSL